MKRILILLLVLLCICICTYYFSNTDVLVIADDIFLKSEPTRRNTIYFTDTSYYKIHQSVLYKNEKFITNLNKDSRGMLADDICLYVSYGDRLYIINEQNGEREVFFDKVYPLFMDELYIFAISSENDDFLKIDRKNKSVENITRISAVKKINFVTLLSHNGYSYLLLGDNISCVINPQGRILFTDRNQQFSENTVLYYDGNKVIYSDIDKECINVYDFQTHITNKFQIEEDYSYSPGRTFVNNKNIYFALEKYTPSIKRTERYHDNDVICVFNTDTLTGEIVYETSNHIVGFDESTVWTYDGFQRVKKVDYLRNTILKTEYIRKKFKSIEFHTQNGNVIITDPISTEIISIFK